MGKGFLKAKRQRRTDYARGVATKLAGLFLREGLALLELDPTCRPTTPVGCYYWARFVSHGSGGPVAVADELSRRAVALVGHGGLADAAEVVTLGIEIGGEHVADEIGIAPGGGMTAAQTALLGLRAGCLVEGLELPHALCIIAADAERRQA